MKDSNRASTAVGRGRREDLVVALVIGLGGVLLLLLGVVSSSRRTTASNVVSQKGPDALEAFFEDLALGNERHAGDVENRLKLSFADPMPDRVDERRGVVVFGGADDEAVRQRGREAFLYRVVHDALQLPGTRGATAPRLQLHLGEGRGHLSRVHSVLHRMLHPVRPVRRRPRPASESHVRLEGRPVLQHRTHRFLPAPPQSLRCPSLLQRTSSNAAQPRQPQLTLRNARELRDSTVHISQRFPSPHLHVEGPPSKNGEAHLGIDDDGL
mmetsp:Transcript_33696/g.107672  ORF Transcript_33696/g.107672 Transcript_33696/m.107672 type:complete len:269 (-) Transcript_33696:2276-3082(-)